MSSIPNSAMPHAHAHHDELTAAPAETPAKPAAKVVAGEGNIARLIDSVKSHPRTGLAVGASIVLGAIAAAAIPALMAEPAPKKRKAKSPAKTTTPRKAA